MSFTPPNHARALVMALFFTWLYIASMLWWHLATRESVEVLTLAGGSISIAVLVYGTTVFHRLFLANVLPFAYNLGGSIWGVPVALVWLLHVVCGLILVGSLAVLVWAWFHARRNSINLKESLPFALVLATPLLIYELIRTLYDVDIFQLAVTGLMGLL